jgi:hypothetical protein
MRRTDTSSESSLQYGKAEFRKPRGLRFAPNGVFYCVARDEIVGFDFASGECLGAVARLSRLNGQAVVVSRSERATSTSRHNHLTTLDHRFLHQRARARRPALIRFITPLLGIVIGHKFHSFEDDDFAVRLLC